MNARIQRSAGLATAGLLWAVIGCGEGKPPVDSTKEEATVKGSVTYKGKTVSKGEIRFDPSNHLRKDEVARRAPIGADGTYEVKTLVGLNRVSFSIPSVKDPQMQDYSLECEVKSGTNTFEAALPPPGATP
ncbi:MAG: hypothetical protein U0800_17765 [Isosphaeraceae bacterium]